MNCMIYYTLTDSPLGALLLTGNGRALLSLSFGAAVPSGARHQDHDPQLTLGCTFLAQYFRGQIPTVQPNLCIRVSTFGQAVLKEVQRIPFGETLSYQELALNLQAQGHKACAQAVGGALRRNPLLLLIPCHRVIGSQGQLRGYAGGIRVQRFLLDHEARSKGSQRSVPDDPA